MPWGTPRPDASYLVCFHCSLFNPPAEERGLPLSITTSAPTPRTLPGVNIDQSISHAIYDQRDKVHPISKELQTLSPAP